MIYISQRKSPRVIQIQSRSKAPRERASINDRVESRLSVQCQCLESLSKIQEDASRMAVESSLEGREIAHRRLIGGPRVSPCNYSDFSGSKASSKTREDRFWDVDAASSCHGRHKFSRVSGHSSRFVPILRIINAG
ncbi:hypothetical protein KM043_004517 [Ampulex compressa]|nr:hypothetical protein KM043_004517 [Ampulex compressa]